MRFHFSTSSAKSSDSHASNGRWSWPIGKFCAALIVGLTLVIATRAQWGVAEVDSGITSDASATNGSEAGDRKQAVNDAGETTTQSSPAGTSSMSSEPNDEPEREIVRLIPDQKVLYGFISPPPTIIDLSDVFADTKIAKRGEPLRVRIEHNKKKKVVKAKLEGTQIEGAEPDTYALENAKLVLDWQEVGSGEITLRVSGTKSSANNSGPSRYLDNKILVEVWKPDLLQLLFTVIGGLGIFLLGMKSMSEGLQAVAGNGLRRLISAVTDNRFFATGVGMLVTMLIQSSSITTVMTVGFVNSGFMTLSQAIGVIMGANIGTTITGWILVLKIGVYGLPMLGVGAFIYLFVRHDLWRYSAMAFMGLGMVFLGLELMKDGFAIVKDLPEFEAWFATFSAGSYVGVLKCALVGCVLTLIVQSSSATLGITVGLAQIGVIEFETAAALVLGENVGTTITAWLASFGTTTNARRAAYFHVLFNLIGVAWITAIFSFYMPFVKWLVASYLGGVNAETGLIDPTTGIAATHTCFNIANTLLFLPLVSVFAALLRRIIPDKKHKEQPHLTSLDIRMLETPVIAIEQSRNELLRMGEGCNKMMEWLKTIVASETPDEALAQKTLHREEVLDTIQDEIVAFMTNMLAGNIPHETINEARRQLRMADEYESVSDYIASILKSHLKLRQSGLQFSEQDRQMLAELHDEVSEYLRIIYDGYKQRQTDVITKAKTLGNQIKRSVKEARELFVQELSNTKVEPLVTVAFNAQLNAYRRVRDHALNIVESLAKVK